MKRTLLVLFSFIAITLYGQTKQVAITVDDLPFAYFQNLTTDEIEEATNLLLDKINRYGIAATGFINGYTIDKSDDVDRYMSITRSWLEKGQVLGNHTYSHPSLTSTSLDDFIADFNKNEQVLENLYQSRQRTGRYFRYPFLQMGSDSLRKNGFQQYLRSVNYQIAPITFSIQDHVYNKVYVEAYLKRDTAMMKKAAESYLKHVTVMVAYYEQLTVEVVGRPIKHTFLCHANLLNAHYFDKVVAILKEQGYSFISLSEALTDKAYHRNDTLTISGGWSHIDRWKRLDNIKTTLIYPKIDEDIMSSYNAK